MIKGRQQFKIITRRGATSEEAFEIVATLQDREIARLTVENERLQRVANEAVMLMSDTQVDEFFGIPAMEG